MKALMLTEYNHFKLMDVETPTIEDNEVLVQVKACGICGSDVHGMDGSTGRRIPPIVMGHEAAGVISRIGSAVTGWKIGDRVTFDSTVYCGTCWYCRRGDIHLCDNRRVLGVSCDEYRRNGAFAESVAVPEHILYSIPERLSFEEAALCEPLSIAVHAVHRTRISIGDTAVVAGSGMIGLLLIQVLRSAGCGKIIAIDLEDDKLAMAERLGATVGLNPRKADPVAAIQGLTGGRGADIAFEVVGIGATLNIAVESLRKGGILTLVGNLTAVDEFPHQAVVTREITLNGSCASRGDYPACLELLQNGAIDTKAFISRTAPLSEGAQWFERLHRKEPGLLKVILVP
ncbi:MAG TPA: galactitol-1-phosphate 5-dehydrogenase [Spirochaetia bacterium]|nr:galactitol-1-phosphate 5-dehydrogenase [Spirochaetia bacterium]